MKDLSSNFVQHFFANISSSDVDLPSKTKSCTQFSFWDSVTKKLVACRNMDGELDVRKVTVSHALIFSVDADESPKKYISVLWPGFVGVLSAINEDGGYLMMNYGMRGVPVRINNLTPLTWIMRNIVAETTAWNLQSMQKAIASYAIPEGGTCSTGCILVFANQKDDNMSYMHPKLFD